MRVKNLDNSLTHDEKWETSVTQPMKVPTCALCGCDEKYQLAYPGTRTKKGLYCPQCNGWTSTVWRERKREKVSNGS
jgi:hypothetical protein